MSYYWDEENALFVITWRGQVIMRVATESLALSFMDKVVL